jgi:EAL domain-containing protein (putative c-di-GMP-specific phosphodiesterase class I)/GGDEF domain-containing protein
MSEERPGLERYRTGYLKMKSVLHDRATGLPAFPLLFDRLRSELESRREIGVVHLEIGNLDLVESLYGWQVFDRIVGRVAELLRTELGGALPAGAQLALNGVAGDSFLLFLPDGAEGREPDPEFLARVSEGVARRLVAAFDEEEFADLGPRLSFRTGAALLSASPFQRFERSVYAAVERARGGPGRRDARRDHAWGEELNEIIRTSAVETLYQPILELDTLATLGHEAFVRGPRGTLFEAPRTMFALSGRVGVAEELDRMCCERVLGEYPDTEPRGKLFVNVLGSLLDADGTRRTRLCERIEEAGLAPENLVLEISERAPEPGSGAFLAGLPDWRAAGFALALDDVGTGRIEHEAIEKVRPDYQKLDSSLVRGIETNLLQQDTLDALVRLARRIGAEVVAEGVEAEAEAQILRQGGARYGQGYLFAPPAPRSRAAGRPR